MITWAGHLVRRLGIVGRVLVIMPHENNKQRASRHDSLVRGEVGVQDNYNRAKVSRGRTWNSAIEKEEERECLSLFTFVIRGDQAGAGEQRGATGATGDQEPTVKKQPKQYGRPRETTGGNGGQRGGYGFGPADAHSLGLRSDIEDP